MALAAYEHIAGPLSKAVKRWGPSRVAILLGTSTGGIDCTEQALDTHRATAQFEDDYSIGRQHNFYAFCDLLVVGSGPAGLAATGAGVGSASAP